MKPTELTTLLSQTIGARIHTLIKGAPGIGKSDIVNQSAQAADADVIVSHPAVADPTDIKGMPWIVDGRATFLPFGDLERARAATRRTVWFLDDLGQASPAVQSGCMPLLDSTRGHNATLGDGAQHIVFVAATNRRSDRAGVSGILEPVKSRFGTIVELEPSIDDWCSWAIDHDIPPALIAYLRFEPDQLSKFEATADLTNSPSPRTWSHVAKLMSLDLPESVRHAAFAGAVGEGAATNLLGFLSLYASLPSVDQILIDPDHAPVPDKTSALYAVATALAHRSTPQNFTRVARYVERMVSAGYGEFGILTIRDAQRRHPEVTQTTAYVRLAVGELSTLIS